MGSKLKTQFCNHLLIMGMVRPYDVIDHSYTNDRINKVIAGVKNQRDGICPTLTTRPDTLGVVVPYAKRDKDKECK